MCVFVIDVLLAKGDEIMYNKDRKLIWGVRGSAILNLHFFDRETAYSGICQASLAVEDRRGNQVTHLA